MSLDPKDSKKGKKKVSSPALHPLFHKPLIDVANVSLEKGYAPLNWLDKDSPVTVQYCIDAAERHLDEIKLGLTENVEKKSDGSVCDTVASHFVHVAYNMLMAEMIRTIFPEKDDRFMKGKSSAFKLEQVQSSKQFLEQSPLGISCLVSRPPGTFCDDLYRFQQGITKNVNDK